jgi:hypothetical protein
MSLRASFIDAKKALKANASLFRKYIEGNRMLVKSKQNDGCFYDNFGICVFF